MPNAIEMTAKRIGRLLVIKRTEGPLGNAWWLCQCDCGNIKVITGANLRSGRVLSCGCLQRENLIFRNTKHGLSQAHKRAFHAWNNMMQRCYNENHPRYYDWGGRGIKVAKEWHSFENFLADMGDPPNKLEIDRKNNNKGYSKDNCRWTTKKVNMNNRRNSKNQEQGAQPARLLDQI